MQVSVHGRIRVVTVPSQQSKEGTPLMARSRDGGDSAGADTLSAPAAVDGGGGDGAIAQPLSADASKNDHTLRTPDVEAKLPALSPQRGQEPKQEPHPQLLVEASVPQRTDHRSSTVTQPLPSQTVSPDQDTSPSSACAASPSLRSPTVNAISERPPSLGEGKNLTISYTTEPAPVRPEERLEPEATARTSSPAVLQRTKIGSRCMPQTAASHSDCEDQTHDDSLEQGTQRSGTGHDAAVCDTATDNALVTRCSAGNCQPAHEVQVQVTELLPSNTERSVSHAACQSQQVGEQQSSHCVPSVATLQVQQAVLELQQQHPVGLQSEGAPLLPEQPPQEECDSTTPTLRGSLSHTASKWLDHYGQYVRVSDTVHLPANWQTWWPESGQQKNYSQFLAEGLEASGRYAAQSAAAPLFAREHLASLPCWPHEAWPMCSSLGLPPTMVPPHSLPELQQHLQKHLLADWSSPLSRAANAYFHNDHTEIDPSVCLMSYNTDRTPACTEALQEARGSYSPGGLWQPALAASVKNRQTALPSGELFTLENGSMCCNNYSITGNGGCGAPLWTSRVHPEQVCHSLFGSSQGAWDWLQQRQNDLIQSQTAWQFHPNDICEYVTRCTAHAALLTSPPTPDDGEQEFHGDWAAQGGGRIGNSHDTRDGTSSRYRWQLLQQLALRYNRPPREAEEAASSIEHDNKDLFALVAQERCFTEGPVPPISHQPCTSEKFTACKDVGSNVSASADEFSLMKAYDAAPTCVTVPPPRSLSLAAAGESWRDHTEGDTLPGSCQTHCGVTDSSGPCRPANRCAGANQFVAADEAAPLCPLQHQTQWVSPPPEAATALAAARAAAASAAAAIAAEWQQHLEQHYLEDWMQQLSPAHQWWLLHLQQTDHLSRRNKPLFLNNWQDVTLDTNIGACAASNAETRSIAESSSLPGSSQEQQLLLQKAGHEDKWTASFAEQQPQELQTCTVEPVKAAASALWNTSSQTSLRRSTGRTRGAEGPCWQRDPETSLQRELQPPRILHSASRHQYPAVHRCGRTNGSPQRRNVVGDATQPRRWEANRSLGAALPAAGVKPNERAIPTQLQNPRHDRHLQRVEHGSATRLSLCGQAEGSQCLPSGQARHSIPYRFGKRWRPVHCRHLAEDVHKDVPLPTKLDGSCFWQRSCSVTCREDTPADYFCERCGLHTLQDAAVKRVDEDCTAAAHLLSPSEEGGKRRWSSLCRCEGDFTESALRCERNAAELDTKTLVRRSLAGRSAVEESPLWAPPDHKRLNTRSCCPPRTRSIMQGHARTESSQGGVRQAGTSAPVDSGGDSALEGGRPLETKAMVRWRGWGTCKKKTESTPANRGGQDAAAGSELRNQVVRTKEYTKRSTAGNLATANGENTPLEGNRGLFPRPAVSCPCGEKCLPISAHLHTGHAAASRPPSSRDSRQPETLRSAKQRLSLWMRGTRYTECELASRAECGTRTCCSSEYSNDNRSNISSGAGVEGEVCTNEIERQAAFATEKRQTQRKSPATCLRGHPKEERASVTVLPASNREVVISVPPSAIANEEKRGETETVSASTARRQRRSHKETAQVNEGAEGQRHEFRTTDECLLAATTATVGTSSSCSAVPDNGDEKCSPSTHPVRNSVVLGRAKHPLKASMPWKDAEAQASVAAGGGNKSCSSRSSSRDQLSMGGPAKRNLDKGGLDTSTLKTRSWLAVVREAAARSTLHSPSTKSTTQISHHLPRKESVLRCPQPRKHTGGPLNV